jgi:carbon dioxide concentrating mechanism protein CcmM
LIKPFRGIQEKLKVVFILAVLLMVLTISMTLTSQRQAKAVAQAESPNVHSNVKTDFNPTITYPHIDKSAFIHPFAVIIGDCYMGKWVLVAPTSVYRGDEGTPIHI